MASGPPVIDLTKASSLCNRREHHLRDEMPHVPSDFRETDAMRGIAQGSSVPRFFQNPRDMRYSCPMSASEKIRQWRALPPERKLRLRWDAIPLNVARSMAFEQEPVSLEMLRAIHARSEPPAMLKPCSESSAIPS